MGAKIETIIKIYNYIFLLLSLFLPPYFRSLMTLMTNDLNDHMTIWKKE